MSIKPDDAADLLVEIQRHVDNANSPDVLLDYEMEDLLKLIVSTIRVFKTESSLVEVTSPVTIVGDIHGQFLDLAHVFIITGYPWQSKNRYIFLGDYVDRGPKQLECIVLLLTLKVALRRRIVLLRGNHECSNINSVYGFLDELKTRFSVNDSKRLWQRFNDVFAYMPLAALVDKRVLCMHGGLSPRQ